MNASSTRVVITAVSTTVVGVLPVFLLGGLASFVRSEVGFDEATLGLVVSAFYAVAALTAIPGGGISDRLGARFGLLIGTSLAACSLIGVALVGDSVPRLAVLMAVAGLANAIIQPAANLALLRGVEPRRLGIAFGIKQSALPISTLIAGLAVPLIALTFGWRWAFGGAALLTATLLMSLARTPIASSGATGATKVPRGTLTRRQKASLGRMGIAAGCGFVAANSIGVFYIQSAELTGIRIGTAGLMLSLGSAMAIAMRLYLGWRSDRRTDNDDLRTAGRMIVIGTAGFFLLAHAAGLPVLLVATFVCFAFGWGWTGILHLGVVRNHLEAPATASGIVNAGSLVGGLAGPALFGWVATNHGYTTAWTTVASFALFGGLLLTWERRAP